MPYIRVMYKTNKFDYVSSKLLDGLIRREKITQFYRTSEERWINVRFDRIRGIGGKYQGPERRGVANSKKLGRKRGFIKVKRPGRNGEKLH